MQSGERENASVSLKILAAVYAPNLLIEMVIVSLCQNIAYPIWGLFFCCVFAMFWDHCIHVPCSPYMSALKARATLTTGEVH